MTNPVKPASKRKRAEGPGTGGGGGRGGGMKTPGELNPETASGQPRSTPGVQYRYVRLTEPENAKEMTFGASRIPEQPPTHGGPNITMPCSSVPQPAGPRRARTRCQAWRLADRATHQVRPGHQPQDREGTRADSPGLPAAASG